MFAKKRRKYILLFAICLLVLYFTPVKTLSSLAECDSIKVFRGGSAVCELTDPSEFILIDHDKEKLVGYGTYGIKDFRAADLFRLRTAYTLQFYSQNDKIMTVRMLTLADDRRPRAETARPRLGEYRSEDQYINDQYIVCYYRRGMFFRFLSSGLEKAVESAL